jgi:hypothetical protein
VLHIAQTLIVCQSRWLSIESRWLSIAIIQADDILNSGLHRAGLYRIPASQTLLGHLSGVMLDFDKHTGDPAISQLLLASTVPEAMIVIGRLPYLLA